MTVPLWAAILIGVSSGLLATLVRIGHERGAEFRTRMLNAAEGFLSAADRASGELRTPKLPTPTGILEGVNYATEAIVPTVSLVHLLYGLDSEVSGLARAIYAEFAAISHLMTISPSGMGLESSAEISEHHRKALHLIGDFTTAASAQVRGKWLRSG